MESKEQILQTALEKHQGYWGLTKAEEVAIYEAMHQYADQQSSKYRKALEEIVKIKLNHVTTVNELREIAHKALEEGV